MSADAATPKPPTAAQARAIEAFATALFELLEARAQSIGLLDIAVEVDGWNIDAELMYTSNPDMGATIDAASGELEVCELLGDDGERWIDDAGCAGLRVLDGDDQDIDALREDTLAVLTAVLDARRPLLRRD